MPRLCPACGGAIDDAFCPWCGLDQSGAEAGALRELAARVDDLDREIVAASTRREVLASELAARRFNAAAGAAPPSAVRPSIPSPPAAPAPEWTVERVRNVLLWVGAALLAASALTFTAVAWSHLGDAGRAALLFATTIVFVATAIALRRRLPASAEAFTALSIAMMLVDWQALRRAGATSGLSFAAAWSIGALVVAMLTLALGRVVGRRSSELAAAILVPASAALAVVTFAGAAWSLGLGFALLAAAVVAVVRLDDGPERNWVRGVLATDATLAWLIAANAVAIAAARTDTFGESLGVAAVTCTLALAPAATIRRRVSYPEFEATATLVVAVLLGALVVAASSAFGPQGLVAWSAVVAGAVAVAAPALGRRWERPALVAAGVFAMPGVAWSGYWGLAVVLGPLSWFRDAWSGTLDVPARQAFGGLHTGKEFPDGWTVVWPLVATAVVLLRFARRRQNALWGAATAAVLAGCLAPVAAGGSAGVALVAATALFCASLIGDAAFDRVARRSPSFFLALAALTAIPTAGWAATTRVASVLVAAVALAAALVACMVARSRWSRVTHAVIASALVVTLVGVATAASGAGTAPTGFAIALAATLLIVGVVYTRLPDGGAVEAVGVAGATIGVLVSASSVVWLAGTLTAMVPLLLAVSLRRTRRDVYAIATGVAAVVACWAWLAAAHVAVVEAYTLPAAAAALAVGLLAWRDVPARSWLTLAPAIVLGLGPTLLVGIAQDDTARTVIAAAAAFFLVLAGSLRRLQAPLALGALALLILAVDTLGPAAARLPRWIPLAVIGALLMWIGTTFERRRDDARRASQHLAGFG